MSGGELKPERRSALVRGRHQVCFCGARESRTLAAMNRGIRRPALLDSTIKPPRSSRLRTGDRRSRVCRFSTDPETSSEAFPKFESYPADGAPTFRTQGVRAASLKLQGIYIREQDDFCAAQRSLIGPSQGRASPVGEGNPGRPLQPGRARRRAPFLPACSFPVPLRKRLIIPCSERRKFPVPRPIRPASGGLQSQQRHDIATLSGTERRPRRKKFPASREFGSAAAGPRARRF